MKWMTAFARKMATLTGLEPATSAVTGRRANQLRHRALCRTRTPSVHESLLYTARHMGHKSAGGAVKTPNSAHPPASLRGGVAKQGESPPPANAKGGHPHEVDDRLRQKNGDPDGT